MSKTKFPTRQGWLTLTISLKPNAVITEAGALKIGCGNYDEYEVGSYRATKKKAVLIYRKKHRLPREEMAVVYGPVGSGKTNWADLLEINNSRVTVAQFHHCFTIVPGMPIHPNAVLLPRIAEQHDILIIDETPAEQLGEIMDTVVLAPNKQMIFLCQSATAPAGKMPAYPIEDFTFQTNE